jgi:hypothetical protein
MITGTARNSERVPLSSAMKSRSIIGVHRRYRRSPSAIAPEWPASAASDSRQVIRVHDDPVREGRPTLGAALALKAVGTALHRRP